MTTSAFPTPAGHDRCCFMGPTGSGKTELAIALLKPMPNVIVVDPKHRFDWGEIGSRYARVAHSLRDLLAQLKDVESRRSSAPVVYRPPTDDLAPANIDRVDEVFHVALSRGHTTVYVDEMSYLTGTANNFQERLPHWFRAVTTGRQLGVGVWSAFQRPANVPLLAMSESDYRFTFYLRMHKDRARAEELCGPIPWDVLQDEEYSFAWATDKHTSAPTRLRLRAPALPATA